MTEQIARAIVGTNAGILRPIRCVSDDRIRAQNAFRVARNLAKGFHKGEAVRVVAKRGQAAHFRANHEAVDPTGPAAQPGVVINEGGIVRAARVADEGVHDASCIR